MLIQSIQSKVWNTLLIGMGVAIMSTAQAAVFGFDLPGNSLGTAIVPQGQFAWEQNLPSIAYDDRVIGSDLTIQSNILARFGLGYGAEVRLGWDGPIMNKTKVKNAAGQTIKTDENGQGDVTVGLKKAMNTNDSKTTWALLAQVNLATGDDEFSIGERMYTLGSAIMYQFSPKISTGMTMMYDRQDGDLAWSAIPNIQYQITEQVSGSADLMYRKQESQDFQLINTNSVHWAIRDNLQLSASLGYSLTDQDPRYTGALSVGYLF